MMERETSPEGNLKKQRELRIMDLERKLERARTDSAYLCAQVFKAKLNEHKNPNTDGMSEFDRQQRAYYVSDERLPEIKKLEDEINILERVLEAEIE